MKLAVVIPVFNEEAVLPEFYRRLTGALRDSPDAWEFLFIDDGSTDGSLELLRGLAVQDARVRVLSLTRNFGHQAAISAGLNHAAAAAAVAILDADLQDPPELLGELVRYWHMGYEVVYAIRRTRRANPVKRFCYYAFYRLLGRIADVDIHPDSGDFCLLDARVASILRNMHERNRFVRGLRSWVGFRQIGVEYDRPERAAGRTHYTWKRLIKLARDGIFSFSYTPLRLALYSGCVSILLSLGLMGWVLYQRLTQASYVPGVTTTLLAVLFFGGWQLFILGLVGEYIGRIYDEVKARPLYLVRERINIGGESTEPLETATRLEDRDAS
jgi:dolichol-phosphate mannosyltransferase